MSERELLKRLIERENNEKYITSNYRRLKKDYADMWIAVENQQVVAWGSDYKSLVKRMKKKLGGRFCGIAVEYIASRDAPLELLSRYR